jgi:hypothetical protein
MVGGSVLYHSQNGLTSIPGPDFRGVCWCEGDISTGIEHATVTCGLGGLLATSECLSSGPNQPASPAPDNHFCHDLLK